MKIQQIRICAAIVFLLAAAAPAVAQQEDQTPATQENIRSSIVILDLVEIRRNALAVQDIRSQISVYREAFQAEIQKEEQELRNANQELARKRPLLSPEAFAEERRKFEQRVVEVRRRVQQSRQDLENAQNQAMVAVEKVLNEIVAQMARERGFRLVLRRSQTVVADRRMVITDEVLDLLNKRLPKVEVPTPGQ